MAIKTVITAQTANRQFDAPDFNKYSMFVGGTNATHHALRNYSPQQSSYGRLFMVRVPHIVAKMFAGGDDIYNNDSLFMQFKHMCEYMNRSVTGFQDITLQNASTAIQGGFAGRKFNTPTVTQDPTDSFTISLYEMNGSPVYTVIDGWMNAIGDMNSGLAHYGGWIGAGKDAKGKEQRMFYVGNESKDGIAYNESEHTCEFIYLLHDKSGAQVERAVLLADCYPTQINSSNALNMADAGVHDNITYDITFNCVVYRSTIINAIANDLLKQYRIVSNSLNFNPELGDAVYANDAATLFQRSLGPVPVDSATGTNIGNVPVYYTANDPESRVPGWERLGQSRQIERHNINTGYGKNAGRPGQTIDYNWDGFADDFPYDDRDQSSASVGNQISYS